jgi:transposase
VISLVGVPHDAPIQEDSVVDGPEQRRDHQVLAGRPTESDLRKVWILTAPTDFMIGHRRFDVIEHLPEAELDTAINEAQMADEARLVRRLCFVKNLYAGDVLEEAARRVGVSQANSSRWAHAWNDAGVDGLRPSFGGGRPPKLSNEQFAELCDVLEEGQPWTPRAIHALIEERYSVTYDPSHLSRKLRESGMYYAKPRPMDPRSPENADEILAERLGEALGEKETEEQEDDPVVLGFFR